MENTYKKIRKYSIRKFKIGAASIFLGCSVFGVSTQEAQAEDTNHHIERKLEDVEVNYISINEEDLTEEEKQLIRNKKEFSKEISDKNKSYIIVYKKEEFKKLADTGLINDNILNLLLLSGVVSLLLLVRKYKHKTLITLISVVTIGSGVGYNLTKAVDNEIKIYLSEKFSNNKNKSLKMPLEKLQNLTLYGYIIEDDLKEGTRLFEFLKNNVSNSKDNLENKTEIISENKVEDKKENTENNKQDTSSTNTTEEKDKSEKENTDTENNENSAPSGEENNKPNENGGKESEPSGDSGKTDVTNDNNGTSPSENGQQDPSTPGANKNPETDDSKPKPDGDKKEETPSGKDENSQSGNETGDNKPKENDDKVDTPSTNDGTTQGGESGAPTDQPNTTEETSSNPTDQEEPKTWDKEKEELNKIIQQIGNYSTEEEKYKSIDEDLYNEIIEKSNKALEYYTQENKPEGYEEFKKDLQEKINKFEEKIKQKEKENNTTPPADQEEPKTDNETSSPTEDNGKNKDEDSGITSGETGEQSPSDDGTKPKDNTSSNTDENTGATDDTPNKDEDKKDDTTNVDNENSQGGESGNASDENGEKEKDNQNTDQPDTTNPTNDNDKTETDPPNSSDTGTVDNGSAGSGETNNTETQPSEDDNKQDEEEKVDKTKLTEKASKEEEIKSNFKFYNADEEKQTAYENTLARAKEILNKDNATKEEVENILSELTTKESELNGVETDKTKLRELYNKSQETKNSVKYTNEQTENDKEFFDRELESSNFILSNEKATQNEVNTALEKLQTALNKLDGEEIEVTEKNIEFRNVSLSELYKVSNDGTATKINNLSSSVSDLENYMAKIVNEGKEILLPVARIEEDGNSYKVVVNLPELISYKNNEKNNEFSFVVKKALTGNNIYTDFSSLISAINNNPSGTFILGSDMTANNVSGNSYINTFSGTLKSADGNKFAIEGLTKPFINSATQTAKIENIEFRNVNIETRDSAGAVVVNSQGATLKGLKVSGNIIFNPNNQNTAYMGGLVSSSLNGNIEKNIVDINITAKDGTHNFGLLAGRAYRTNVSKNMISGDITVNNSNPRAYIGNVLGAASLLDIDNIILNEDVKIENFMGYNSNSSASNINKIGNNFTREQANNKLKEWGMISENKETTTASELNYSTLNNYNADKEISYYNTRKLLPFYDRDTIIKYGNLVASDSNLHSKKIENIFMLDNNNRLSATVKDVNNIKKLLVKYEDQTIETINLTAVGIYKNTGVMEYSHNGNLLFTPEQFISDNTLVTEVSNELKTVDLDSAELRNILKIDEYNSAKRALNDKHKDVNAQYLYLHDSLNELKANIEEVTSNIISSNFVANTNSEAVKKYIKKELSSKKNNLMLALSYVNRLYSVNYDESNIKNIMMYRQDFYNKDVVTLDQLIKLSNLGFEKLLLNNNYTTFGEVFSNLNKGDLISFLEANKNIFAKDKDLETWFKESTKAFIHEERRSDDNSSSPVYTRLKQKEVTKNYILPLLNLKEDNVYVVTVPYVTFFGSYGRVFDQNIDKNSSEYKNEVEKAHAKVLANTKNWSKYMELYEKLFGENGKNYMNSHLTEVFDGYEFLDETNGAPRETHVQNSPKVSWAGAFDNKHTAVKDFFGPIGRYYGKTDNSAYTNRETKVIRFASVDILGHEGGATLNHELVHNYDTDVVLGGYGYREGQDAESYALGMFESIMTKDDYYYGFNFMYDIVGDSPFNKNISRFNNKEDLQNYTKGLLDSIYLLDSIEADIIVKQFSADKKYLFNKIELKKDPQDQKNIRGILHKHANDEIKAIDDAQWNNITLNSINDIIDNQLVANSSLLIKKTYNRDNATNYYFLPLYYPIYSAYENNEGTSGGLMFRMTAFEMLAEFGWDNGFLPYATNKYFEEAINENKPLSDTYIFKKIFNGQFENYKAFKKEMYKRRFDQKDSLKQITINYKGQNHTLTAEKLNELMTEAIRSDLEKLKANSNGFERQTLKAAIIKELNKVTNEYRESIFNK